MTTNRYVRQTVEIPKQQLQQWLKHHYGIIAELTSLDADIDPNYKVTSDSGDYVLKVSLAAESESLLESQNQLLLHLQSQASQLTLPTVRPSHSGEYLLKERYQNQDCILRLLSFVPGRLYAEGKQTPALVTDLGSFLGQLNRAMQGFSLPYTQPGMYWDPCQAKFIESYFECLNKPEQREMVEGFYRQFQNNSAAKLASLPCAMIHNDANDYNLLIDQADAEKIAGLIDFGDALYTCRINEVAVALAYALMNEGDIFLTARSLIAAYNKFTPLQSEELAVLYDLIALRLCTSVLMSSWRSQQHPDNAYLLVSQADAFALLEQWKQVNPKVAEANFRAACGMAPIASEPLLSTWLQQHQAQFFPLLGRDLAPLRKQVFSYAAGSQDMQDLQQTASAEEHTALLWQRRAEQNIDVYIGNYLEDRAVYSGDNFIAVGSSDRRSVHLGIDLFIDAQTPLYAPMDAVVYSVKNNTIRFDYGPTVILRHDIAELNISFYTLYGHLSINTLQHLKPGQKIKQGDVFAWIGSPPDNGDWVPHVHFQIMSDMLGLSGNFPGVAATSQLDVWKSICLDPNLILAIPQEFFSKTDVHADQLITRRKQHLAASLSLSYENPLHIVRGNGVYLYDSHGRAYLDCVNNISHVGHSHAHVVEALSQQAAVLNTNTRYLHENILNYAQRLCDLFPESLDVCYFVCSGSEANELALRLAQNYTQQRDIIVLDHAYHGNTSRLIDISPYKHNGPGGKGPGDFVSTLPIPDTYRGLIKSDSVDAAGRYAAYVDAVLNDIHSAGRAPAAFIAESIPGCAGQVVLPPGYLSRVYEKVRSAGGVCIADEVQVGFARVGQAFWGYELQSVAPDIVTLGKPMGNGHPIAAVITSRKIADAFNNGMEYFNSFGGNPVSCATANAVLDVIEQEGLQHNAQEMGDYLLHGLCDLQAKHDIIGDVRGHGLFLGIELVKNKTNLEPAADIADLIINQLREQGILLSTDGPLHNVLKIKPPMVFNRNNAKQLLSSISDVLNKL